MPANADDQQGVEGVEGGAVQAAPARVAEQAGTWAVPRTEKRSRARAGRRKRLGILGTPVDNLTLDEAIGVMDRFIRDGGFHQVATANVDFLIKAIHDEDLAGILQRCALVLPDGMPIVWASRLLGHPLRERVTGADLVPRLAELAARNRYGIYLLGAEEHSSAAAAAWIQKMHPGARVVGRCSPPFGALDAMDHEAILRDIRKADPDILLVAFGNPKQEKWLAMHSHRMKVPVCVGVGASLNFLGKTRDRAPSWMQSCGLEWLHRLLQEPRRLAPRYLSNAAGLLRYLPLQLVTMSAQQKSAVSHALVHPLGQRWAMDVSVVSLPPVFAGHVVTEFDSLLYQTGTTSCSLVIDMAQTRSLGADGLGALISLQQRMAKHQCAVWLAGVRPGVRRVFRASKLESRFPIADSVEEAIRGVRGELAGEQAQSDFAGAG